MQKKSLFKKIMTFGVTDDMPFRLQNKLRVFNSAAFFISLINVGYAIAGLFSEWYLASFLSVVSIAFLCTGWALIANKKFIFTFHLIMGYAYCFLFGYVWLFGVGTQSHLYFLFLPVASTIMFEKRAAMLTYLLLTLTSLVIVRYMYLYATPHYTTKNDMLWIFGTLNTCFTAALIFSGVSLFKRENQGYSEEVEQAKEAITQKNKEITDSINYAGTIQRAIIPGEDEFISAFSEAFVLLKPKDIVSGDFYWISKKKDSIFFACADCTGHGVPGGFMTMLGISFLDEIVNEKNIEDPAAILDTLREKIIYTLKQTDAAGENKDGMDLVICRFNTATRELSFAGANNSLYTLRGNLITEHKNNKQPCGFFHLNQPFTSTKIQLQKDDSIFLFTDGFPDQFGGTKGKKFKYRQLEETIAMHSAEKMSRLKPILTQTFDKWKGNFEQVDDVLIMGVRVS